MRYASVFISEYRNQFSKLQRPDTREAFEAMLATPKAERRQSDRSE